MRVAIKLQAGYLVEDVWGRPLGEFSAGSVGDGVRGLFESEGGRSLLVWLVLSGRCESGNGEALPDRWSGPWRDIGKVLVFVGYAEDWACREFVVSVPWRDGVLC